VKQTGSRNMADNQHIKCKTNNGKRRQIAEILRFNRKSGSANRIVVASGFIAGTPPVDKTLSRTITKTILFLDWKKTSSWLVGKNIGVGYQSKQFYF